MKGAEVKLHAFLTLELDGDDWLASYSARLTPRKTVPLLLEQRSRWAETELEKKESPTMCGIEISIHQPILCNSTDQLCLLSFVADIVFKQTVTSTTIMWTT
jgi:hypothetical protein